MSAFYDLNKTPRNILNQAIVRAIVSENNGAWFDPEDMSTMYQDSTGTTPVTAVEQPVGLMLDKSRGMMLGPELVSNGTFDTDTIWTKQTGWSISTGSARCDGSQVSTSLVYQDVLELGKCYRIEFDVVITAGNMSVRTGATGADSTVTTSGRKTQTSFCVGNTILQIRANVGFVGSIDNISVHELYGYHAAQPITASRPTLSARYNLLTKTEDFADAVWVKQFAGTASAPVVTNNYGVAPDGSTTAARLQLALNGGTTTTDRSCLLQQPAMISGTNYASTFWVKSNTAQSYVVQQRLGLAAQNITIDQTWRAYTYSQTVASDNTHWLALRGAQGTSDAADILIWHPQLIIGATPGQYQRVNTATDYDTDERYFKKYLRFDGVDDYLNLPYMGLYAAGSASVVGGLSVTSALGDILCESNSANRVPFYRLLRQSSDKFKGLFYRADSDYLAMNVDTLPSPSSGLPRIVSSIDTGSKFSLHDNGGVAVSATYARGTTTLSNTTIGSLVRTTTTDYIAMNLYGMVITKSALSDTDRRRCEQFLASRLTTLGVTLS